MMRLLRRVSRGGPFAAVEIVLLLGLALALARLVWAIVTPVGPLGDWRPRPAAVPAPAARAALFARVDPFYRTAVDQGPQTITSLSLKLFGVRINEATGRGSAIVAPPDGVQSSYAVGDEVAPGVTLKAVAIDHIVLDRGGASESLYIDQSGPAPAAAPDAPDAAAAAADTAPPQP